MIKNEVIIQEYRLLELLMREKESENLFEELCRIFTIQYLKCKSDNWRDNYNQSVAEFVNLQIQSCSIKFNGKTPSVWFNGMGHGNMMYWAYKDSKIVPGIDNILTNI